MQVARAPGRVPAHATTVRVLGIPEQLNQESLLTLWPADGSFDLLHLPFSYKQRNFMGCAIVNFTSTASARRFYRQWHGRFLIEPTSQRPLTVALAEVQGFAGNVQQIKSRLWQLRSRNLARLVRDGHLPAVFEGTRRLGIGEVCSLMGLPAGTAQKASTAQP